MKKLRTLIDTFTGKMYLVGPGGYEIRLSPGSEVHSLEESPAGHLMLPCSRFRGQQRQQHQEDSQTFVVGEYFIVKEDKTAKAPPTGSAPSANARRRQRDLRAASSESS